MSEKLKKNIPKWSQNLSKIDPEEGLEASWEPPLKQGASKTSFLMILAPFWDPLRDHVGFMLGIFFDVFFNVTFRWPWPPFGLPKHLQNETQKGAKDTSYQKVKIELSLQPELDPEGRGGAENH